MTFSDSQLLELLNQAIPPSGALLGAKVIALDSREGTLQMSFIAKPEFCNSMGVIQGGFVAAMLDETAGNCAFAHAQRRVGLPTLEFKTTFLSASRPGTLVASAEVLRSGRRFVFVSVTLRDEENKKLAIMSSTAAIIEA